MSESKDFLRRIVEEDLKSGKYKEVVTRFPPEPNGFPHIGHAKSITINFGIARDYHGHCNLRMDDTNPTTEETKYVEALKDAVHWLGFDWGDRIYHTSDYFPELYDYAVELIKMDKAYVDSLTEEEIREYRGTVTEPGRRSKYAQRSVEENLDLFEKMKKGEFEEGEHVQRAKIDMSAANMKMRDPLLYRIRHAHHFRSGDVWSIYPMYDFAHCLSDYIEGITHSFCTLEFENNREIYDWILDTLELGPPRPYQYEFARLNINYTVMSKRKLLELVERGLVNGWDDPRMPTLSGLRRRGYSPEAIREFADRIGVAKTNSTVDFALLDHTLREDLNKRAIRMMAVLNPLKVIIDNYPEGQVEEMDAVNNPEDESAGSRKIPCSREIYIEREDFREEANRKWFRLKPGKEVRLKHAYYITCTDVIKDASGEITELHCTYDPKSKGGWTDDGRKVKGTLHWVSAAHAVQAEVRLYEHLFLKENPYEVEDGQDFTDNINPNSLIVLTNSLIEPALTEAQPGEYYQFLRQGYFCADPDSTPDKPVFNRTVTLRDSWAKIEKKFD